MEECAVLEDSDNGVAAGIAAGARVLGVGARAVAGPASIVVRDLRGLRWDGAELEIPPSVLAG